MHLGPIVKKKNDFSVHTLLGRKYSKQNYQLHKTLYRKSSNRSLISKRVINFFFRCTGSSGTLLETVGRKGRVKKRITAKIELLYGNISNGFLVEMQLIVIVYWKTILLGQLSVNIGFLLIGDSALVELRHLLLVINFSINSKIEFLQNLFNFTIFRSSLSSKLLYD